MAPISNNKNVAVIINIANFVNMICPFGDLFIIRKFFCLYSSELGTPETKKNGIILGNKKPDYFHREWYTN